MLTNICEDCASAKCCAVTVIRKEIINQVDCGICYDYAGISSPSVTNILYICNDIVGTPSALIGVGAEVPSYTNVAAIDALTLSTGADQVFLSCFNVSTQPTLIRQIAIDVHVNLNKNAGLTIDTTTLHIYNFTSATWVSLTSLSLVTDAVPITKISGNIFDNIAQYINLGFIYSKVSTGGPLTIINMDYAELCLTCCQDGADGTISPALKTVDYSTTVIPTVLEAIFTNNGIAITTSPEDFIADGGTQAIGPGNTHNASGFNVDYSRVAARDALFIGVDSPNPRVLARMYCSADEFIINVNQIDIETWISIGRSGIAPIYAPYTLLIWNFASSAWEVIVLREVVTNVGGAPPYSLCRTELKTLTPTNYIQNNVYYCMGYVDGTLELDYFYIRSYLRTGWAAPKLQYMSFGVNTILGLVSPGLLYSEGSSLGVPVYGRGIITEIRIIASIINSNTFRIIVNGVIIRTFIMEATTAKSVCVQDLFVEDGDIVQIDHVGILLPQVYVKLQLLYEIGPSTFYG